MEGDFKRFPQTETLSLSPVSWIKILIYVCVSVCLWSTHIDHVPPALCLSTEQGLVVGQPRVVNAHVHALVQRLDGWEHGQDFLLVGQVTLVRDKCAAVAGALTLCCQLLKNTNMTEMWDRAGFKDEMWGSLKLLCCRTGVGVDFLSGLRHCWVEPEMINPQQHS